MGTDVNNRINASISLYLRLLSGHLQLSATLKTPEYLIRRYNNNKWKFWEGVKVSGASSPRTVILQQCIHDKGVLEVLCNYVNASPSKKFIPSRAIINFCTAVVVEALGSVTTVDSDAVKRILPFVVSGLQPGTKGDSDHKAGALMIVSLSPKLVRSLIRSIAEIAREVVKESTDLQWFWLSLMALINLVQLQPVDTFPKKALDILKEIRDIAGVLVGLSKEFHIDRFLAMLLESLVDYSSSDDLCHLALVSIIEKVPMKNLVGHVISKVLLSCRRLSQNNSNSISSVLMQTRSEKVRSRILELRIVKYLLENLKEECLVLLAETIPLLGELLEDVELPVRSLSQDNTKETESMSGESLRQCL